MNFLIRFVLINMECETIDHIIVSENSTCAIEIAKSKLSDYQLSNVLYEQCFTLNDYELMSLV